MSLTTALYTGLSGLAANQVVLDVIGNNIANTNTTAFKASRALLNPQVSQTSSYGASPSGVFGGTNPTQKGLGSMADTIQRNFSTGNLQPTGLRTDLAVEGEGLFIVEDQQRCYTRAGTFQLNADKYLTTADGQYLMGYGVDSDFNVVGGALTRIQVPTGLLTIAKATSNIGAEGQLRTNGDLATAGTIMQSETLVSLIGPPITGGSFLTDLALASDPLVPIFSDGEVISFNCYRGPALQEERQMTVTAGTTTVQDLMDFLVEAWGIHTDPAIPLPGSTQVLDLGGGNYALEITGNVGEANALSLGTGGLRSVTTGSGIFTFSETQAAVGESVYTTEEVYDSLGNPIQLDITMVFESKDNTGTQWRFFANSPDDSDTSSVLGSGLASFDTSGVWLDTTGSTLRIDRDLTGALTPLSIVMDLSGVEAVDGGARTTSYLEINSQDGSGAQTLADFAVAEDGTLIGAFDRGETRTLGQVVLATFANYSGLIDTGSNMYTTGPNSGDAVVSPPMVFGAGRVIGGTLETSNVDIAREFIGLITTSTGFSAASRVITTSNELLTELMAVLR